MVYSYICCIHIEMIIQTSHAKYVLIDLCRCCCCTWGTTYTHTYTTTHTVHCMYLFMHTYVRSSRKSESNDYAEQDVSASNKYAHIFHALLHVCPPCGDSYSLTAYCICLGNFWVWRHNVNFSLHQRRHHTVEYCTCSCLWSLCRSAGSGGWSATGCLWCSCTCRHLNLCHCTGGCGGWSTC